VFFNSFHPFFELLCPQALAKFVPKTKKRIHNAFQFFKGKTVHILDGIHFWYSDFGYLGFSSV
jgi:hypothetical protein